MDRDGERRHGALRYRGRGGVVTSRGEARGRMMHDDRPKRVQCKHDCGSLSSPRRDPLGYSDGPGCMGSARTTCEPRGLRGDATKATRVSSAATHDTPSERDVNETIVGLVVCGMHGGELGAQGARLERRAVENADFGDHTMGVKHDRQCRASRSPSEPTYIRRIPSNHTGATRTQPKLRNGFAAGNTRPRV